MVFENKKWGICNYLVNLTIKTTDKTFNVLPVQILQIYIERNYDTNNLPIIILETSLPKDWLYEIIKNQYNTSFVINMTKETKIENDMNSRSTKSSVMNDIFVPLLNDNNPFIDEKLFNQIKYGTAGTKTPNISQNDLTDKQTFVLVKKRDLLATKHISNMVLKQSNMISAVSLCLQEAGIGNVLMSSMDNTDTYKELLLLPLPLVSQLNYLNSFYGFYKEGSQIFFDIDCMYILRNTAKCTAWRKNEIKTVTFVVNGPTGSGNTTKGTIVDNINEIVYMSINKEEINITNSSNSLDHIIGNNSIVLNDLDTDTLEVKGQSTQIGSGSYNIKTTNTHNKYVESEIALRNKENSCIVTITCRDIDTSYITPNKLYKITSNVSSIADKIKGDFRLSSSVIIYGKQGEQLEPVVKLILKKTN